MALHRNVGNLERAASIAAGLALLAWSGQRRSSHAQAAFKKTAATLGASLIGRGVSGFCPVNAMVGRERRRDDTREALGGSRGVHVNESITINVPVAEIYPLWRDPSHAARFMRDVERVDVVDDQHSRCTVRGPAGVKLTFDSEIINAIDNELVAWRTLPGADVASAGSVHFRSMGDSMAEVTVRLQYDPPAGKAGAAVAAIAGRSPASRLREDLRRLKALLETGEVPTVNGQPSGRRRAVDLARLVDA